jgi:hypothetical protein
MPKYRLEPCFTAQRTRVTGSTITAAYEPLSRAAARRMAARMAVRRASGCCWRSAATVESSSAK